MIILIGAIIVIASVAGGFVLAGGHLATLMHLSELIIIGGAGLGALIIMSPRKVLVDMGKQLVRALRGAPHNQHAYQELLKALYELFLLGRRNGMIALEDHVMNPQTSSILTKYTTFITNQSAVTFLCNSLRPVIDGKIKPEQLKILLDVELDSLEMEDHAPVNVLTKAADAMPGFGIVAAVLGIVITMGSISGPIEKIGEKVGAALVGTFLGIFLSYGFMNPLAMNLEFVNASHHGYARCIATAVAAFVNGLSPMMAVELARRGLNSDVRPSADELEALLKGAAAPAKAA
jgi:chemotaxis protein MotA